MKMRHTIDSINERIHERGLICISYAGLSGFDGCTEWLKWDNRILEMLEATREN